MLNSNSILVVAINQSFETRENNRNLIRFCRYRLVLLSNVRKSIINRNDLDNTMSSICVLCRWHEQVQCRYGVPHPAVPRLAPVASRPAQQDVDEVSHEEDRLRGCHESTVYQVCVIG